MAEAIVLNAKLQRPSVCNAIETILIDENWFKQHGLKLLDRLQQNNVKIYADEVKFIKQHHKQVWQQKKTGKPNILIFLSASN